MTAPVQQSGLLGKGSGSIDDIFGPERVTIKTATGQRVTVPKRCCHVCWIRWGRAFVGKATEECKTKVRSCKPYKEKK